MKEKENIFHKMVWVVLGKTKKINDIYCIIYVKQQLGYDIQFHTAIKIRKGRIFYGYFIYEFFYMKF